MVEEEERLEGLVIVNPHSEYLDPSTFVLPPSMLTLSAIIATIEYHVCAIIATIEYHVCAIIATIEYHVCDGPIGLRHERFN